MKTKLFASLLVVLFAIDTSIAQISEGTKYVAAGSNLGFTSTKTDGVDDALNNFNIGARAGYFVAENLAIGLLFDFDQLSQGSDDLTTTTFGFFGRYYIDGAFFLGAGYSSSKTKFNDVSGSALGSIPLEVGYAAFVKDILTIEPSLSYALGTGDNNSNTLGLNVSFGLYLGRQSE